MAYKWLSLGQNHQEYHSFALWPKYIKLVLSADQSSLVAVVPQTAFLVLLTGFYKATCTKTLAKNHRKLRCNSCSTLHHNKWGQVKPTKFKRQFQSLITTWMCPRCVTKSLLAELPMAGTVLMCLVLMLRISFPRRRRGKSQNVWWGFWFRSIIRTGCLGITRLRRDCCRSRLPGLNSLTTHNLSSRGCVFFSIDQGKLCAVCKVRPKPVKSSTINWEPGVKSFKQNVVVDITVICNKQQDL